MRIFVETDLAQAEWVVTAFLSRDENMLKVVSERLNPHEHTGAAISGAPKTLVKLEKDLVGHNTNPDTIRELRRQLPTVWDGRPLSDFFLPRTMSIYQAGKKSNHGLNYNMMYKRFAFENEIPEPDAAKIVEGYHNTYPGIRFNYYVDIEKELNDNNRTLRNCYGQTIRLLDRWGPDLFDAAYAFKPQSTVGNITKFGWRKIYADTERLRRVEPAPNVHDSILCQHDFDTWDELAEQINICSDYLSTPFTYHSRTHIIPREVTIGLNWGAYNKDSNARGMREVHTDLDSHVILEHLKEVGGTLFRDAEM